MAASVIHIYIYIQNYIAPKIMRTNLRRWHWMVKADWKRWIRWCITLARLMTSYHVGDCCTVWWLSGSSIVVSSTRQRRSWLASTKLCRCSGCSTSMNESSRFSLDSCCCWVVLGLYCPHARHRYGPFLHMLHIVWFLCISPFNALTLLVGR